MNASDLRLLLDGVRDGSVTTDQAYNQLRDLSYQNLGYARVDHHRSLRKGLPEVVFCEGKTPEQAAVIFEQIAVREQQALGTRAEAAHAQAICERVPAAKYHPLSRVVLFDGRAAGSQTRHASVVVATGGTADIPVAEEAALTAVFGGCQVTTLYDVGVAGLHRLLDQAEILSAASVVIAVAGMDGALPGVIGGLVPCPVIAVPTSIGYGTGLGGVAALMNMLNACAPGIAVVNIDNGFGAGYLATLIARKAELPA
jgi:pyridinium-3,5-biscarboxylic acid mononucleotide synthase